MRWNQVSKSQFYVSGNTGGYHATGLNINSTDGETPMLTSYQIMIDEFVLHQYDSPEAVTCNLL